MAGEAAGDVSADRVLAALDAALSSDTFSGSDRLAGFLEYVVKEELAGRGDLIRGKSIAMDLYRYGPRDIERHESVVRVDAGRLRRKLDEYYRHEGAQTAVRFQLPKGQYQPVFVTAEVAQDETRPKQPQSDKARGATWAIGLAGIAVLGAISAVYLQPDPVQEVSRGSDTELADAQRKALFDTSPERLQAINLAQQGRSLIFPATDPKRLNATKLIFESAIQLDETYSGGYAGLSQVSGIIALVAPDPTRTEAMLDAAILNADKALALEPDSSWAISARAWSEFASGNYEAALLSSRNARTLAPDDPNILEFDTLISLYSGEFDDVIQATAQMADATQGSLPFVFQNARSAAFFHEGDFRKAIEGFEDAIASGAPLGPISVAYLMASHHFLGNDRRAKELAIKYKETWPQQRADLLSARLFRDQKQAAKLAEGMSGAGWSPER